MKTAFSLAIPKLALLAVAKFAAKNDIRYYLNAVCIEVGEFESRLIATNGHIIGVYRIEDGADVPCTQSVIIPIGRVNAIEPPTGDGKFGASIELQVEEPSGAQRFARFIDNDTTTRFPLIDGKFPRYRELFQIGRPNNKPSAFQMQYLIACRDAGKILDGANKSGCNFTISHNGDALSLVRFADVGLVVGLMPLRASMDHLDAAPEWIADFPQPPIAPGEQTDIEDQLDPFAGSDLARNPEAQPTSKN